MYGNFLFNLAYETHCRRNGLEPSPQVEADYRDQRAKSTEAAKIHEKVRDEERAAYAASLPIVPMPFIKAGRLLQNTDRGAIVHAVMSNGLDAGYGSWSPTPALCGDAPKITWSSADDYAVTCPKCLKNLPAA